MSDGAAFAVGSALAVLVAICSLWVGGLLVHFAWWLVVHGWNATL